MAKQGDLLRLAVALAVMAMALGGCARISTDPSNWFSKSDDTPATSGAEGGFTVSRGPTEALATRAVAASDLVGADGRCEGVPETPPEGAPARGVALTMTECELVAAAGTPEQVNLGASEDGARRAVLTYTKGDNAGIYTFVAGRLKIIERLPTPPKPERRRRSRQRRA